VSGVEECSHGRTSCMFHWNDRNVRWVRMRQYDNFVRCRLFIINHLAPRIDAFVRGI